LKDHGAQQPSPAAGGTTSLKGRFPFRLATTSYIIPAPIVPNVAFLAPLVDEVELVLFESGRDGNLPTPEEITVLGEMADRHGLTYNVHLPTDVRLGHPDEVVRRRACGTILRFLERTAPLKPTLYCLHLEKNGPGDMDRDEVSDWLWNLLRSLEELLGAGLDTARTAVENLDYTFTWVYPLLRDLGLPVCLDVGHLLAQGEDVPQALDLYGPETVMVHLHGLEGGKDHRSLAGIPDGAWGAVSTFLRDFRGSASIEVFSWDDLEPSLRRLEGLL